jgi:hypothetical protein
MFNRNCYVFYAQNYFPFYKLENRTFYVKDLTYFSYDEDDCANGIIEDNFSNTYSPFS